jgi:hypothetical protein
MVSTEGLEEEKKRAIGREGEPQGKACENIDDPIRRGLCKVCNMPVVGEAPFCKDHEPPVP